MEKIILNKKFQGPFNSFDELKNAGGVYILMCDAFGMTPIRVLHAGGAGNVKEVLKKEDNEKLLDDSDGLPVKILVHYEKDKNQRIRLVNKIKKVVYPVM